jgi:acetolactate synthase small subunit
VEQGKIHARSLVQSYLKDEIDAVFDKLIKEYGMVEGIRFGVTALKREVYKLFNLEK